MTTFVPAVGVANIKCLPIALGMAPVVRKKSVEKRAERNVWNWTMPFTNVPATLATLPLSKRRATSTKKALLCSQTYQEELSQ